MGRKKILFIILLPLILLLTSCYSHATKETPYSVATAVNAQTLTIVFDENTVSSGRIQSENGKYLFRYEPNSDGTSFSVTYPDGYVYSQTEHYGALTSPSDYNPDERLTKGYIDGLSLRETVDRAAEQVQENHKNRRMSPVPGLFLIACGLWIFHSPKSIWWLTRGWWYQNAEPSTLALTLYSALGILLVFAGAIILIASL